MLSLLNKLTCKLFVGNGVKFVSAGRNLIKTHNLYGYGRACLFKLFAALVCHNSDSAHGRSGNYDVARPQRTVLYKERRNGASALIKLSLYYNTLCSTVRICFKLKHFRNEKYRLEKLVDAHMSLSRNGNTYYIAAPFLGNQVILGELLKNSVR